MNAAFLTPLQKTIDYGFIDAPPNVDPSAAATTAHAPHHPTQVASPSSVVSAVPPSTRYVKGTTEHDLTDTIKNMFPPTQVKG